jgi:hypothetical protein
MKVRVFTDEKLQLYAGWADPAIKNTVTVPDELVLALERAEKMRERTVTRILQHLRSTGQTVPEAYQTAEEQKAETSRE